MHLQPRPPPPGLQRLGAAGVALADLRRRGHLVESLLEVGAQTSSLHCPPPFLPPGKAALDFVLISKEPMCSAAAGWDHQGPMSVVRAGVGPMRTVPDCDIDSASLFLRNNSVRCRVSCSPLCEVFLF